MAGGLLRVKSFQGIARNMSIVAGAQLVTWTATFLFTLAQARFLGPSRFADLSVALSYAALLGVVVDFGLSTKLARDVAQQPRAAGKLLAAALALRVALWCAAMPLVWFSTVALGYPADLQAAVLILCASLLVGGVATTLGAYFQGREEFVFPALASIAQRGSAALIGVIALALGHGIAVVAGVYMLASLLQVLVLAPGMRKRPVAFAVLERGTVTAMFNGAAVLGFFWILGSVYYNVDLVILQRLVPAETVAQYAAAYRLFNAAGMLVGFASGTVLYPVLSRLAAGTRDGLRGAMARSFTFLCASGIFLTLTMVIEAEQIVALLYPAHEYGGAATSLRLLAPALGLMHASGVFFLALLGLGYERRLLVMAALLAALNPIANIVTIPLFQEKAAAAITTLTEAAVLVWMLALTPKDLRSAASLAVVAKLAAAAVPAGFCLVALRDLSVIVAVPAAAIVYGVVALALGTLPADDVRALRALLQRTRRDTLDAAPITARRTAEP